MRQAKGALYTGLGIAGQRVQVREPNSRCFDYQVSVCPSFSMPQFPRLSTTTVAWLSPPALTYLKEVWVLDVNPPSGASHP